MKYQLMETVVIPAKEDLFRKTERLTCKSIPWADWRTVETMLAHPKVRQVYIYTDNDNWRKTKVMFKGGNIIVYSTPDEAHKALNKGV